MSFQPRTVRAWAQSFCQDGDSWALDTIVIDGTITHYDGTIQGDQLPPVEMLHARHKRPVPPRGSVPRIRVRLIAAVAPALLVAGCGRVGPEDIEVTLSAARAAPGSTVRLTVRAPASLEKRGLRGIGSTLEQRSGDRWVARYTLLTRWHGNPRPSYRRYDPVDQGVPGFGVRLDGVEELALPRVPPGKYRIRKVLTLDQRQVEFYVPLTVG